MEQVPGYADVIKRPMDLGTMTMKVEKGRYRSLEDFAVRNQKFQSVPHT
jgi:bromodomain-containing protein 7/9